MLDYTILTCFYTVQFTVVSFWLKVVFTMRDLKQAMEGPTFNTHNR